MFSIVTEARDQTIPGSLFARETLGTRLQIYRPETFAAHSPITMLLTCEFLSPFGITTLLEGKVFQSVSTILSKAVVAIDITGNVFAQTSSFIFTVQTSCKSVYSMIRHTDE